MSLFGNIAALLRAPVGNNLENRPEDVENVKRNFAAEGRYKRPVENGYIDQDLDDAIYSFQRDNNLKIDGRMNPGGETEATLVGKLMKLPEAKPMSEEEQKQSGFQKANVLVNPLTVRLAVMLGTSTLAAEQWWQSKTPEEREDAVRSMGKSLEGNPNGDENRKEECGQEYADNLLKCKDTGNRSGWRAKQVCEETAFSRYSQCLTNKPKDPKDRVRIQRF